MVYFPTYSSTRATSCPSWSRPRTSRREGASFTCSSAMPSARLPGRLTPGGALCAQPIAQARAAVHRNPSRRVSGFVCRSMVPHTGRSRPSRGLTVSSANDVRYREVRRGRRVGGGREWGIPTECAKIGPVRFAAERWARPTAALLATLLGGCANHIYSISATPAYRYIHAQPDTSTATISVAHSVRIFRPLRFGLVPEIGVTAGGRRALGGG